LTDAANTIPEEAMEMILNGGKKKIHYQFKEVLPENTKLILKDFAFHQKINMTKAVQQA
jgi:hypothetical protein